MIKQILLFFLLFQWFNLSQGVAQSNPKISIQPADREKMLATASPRAMDVLKFWFEKWDQDKISGGRGEYNSKWFPEGHNPAHDDQRLRELFLDLFEKAVHQKLNWNIQQNPYDNLAWVLLTDQFPRGMFRGTPASYKYDKLALSAAKINVQKHFSNYYFTGYQKLFVTYPFMHDEKLESQQECINLITELNETPGFYYEFLLALKRAYEHYQMIAMFGRFPHRNKRLNRESTELEKIYLSKKGSPGYIDGSQW
ncbi:MAG: DUF924 domain-containing protein [Endozoicomonadaceae bacterium]|nr:DUF924 domain-containing protein [Endozoicomonadaceae bacterium]